MNELIKIQEQNGKQAVSARELHSFLESKKDFSSWIKHRIEKYDLVENQDYVRFTQKGEANNATLIEYALTLDAAKELSMVEGNTKGKQARKYFIEVEKKARELAKPMSTLDILEMNIKQLREQESRVNNLEKKMEVIEAKTQTTPDYFTIIGYAMLNKVQIGLQTAARLGIKAAKICRDKGYRMDEVPDPRFGRVRSYPKTVLEQVFSEPII